MVLPPTSRSHLAQAILIAFLAAPASLSATWSGLPSRFYADDPFVLAARELPGTAAVYTVIENGKRAIELDLLTRTDPGLISDLYRDLAHRLGFPLQERTAKVEPFGTLLSTEVDGLEKRLYLVSGPKGEPTQIRLTAFTDCPRLARAYPSVLQDFPELLRTEGRLLLHREILHPEGRSASFTYETSMTARHTLGVIGRDLLRLGWKDLEGRGGLSADGTCLEGRMATYQKGRAMVVLFCGTSAGRAGPNTLSLLVQEQPASTR
ncbi:MAG: hypothetical protein OHK005_04180 [Candidatus Methylacidiphilales bacterium]